MRTKFRGEILGVSPLDKNQDKFLGECPLDETREISASLLLDKTQGKFL
jgi:hypothetical protein